MNIKKIFGAALATVAISLSTIASATPAYAWLHPGPTTQYPIEGGTWQYGHWDATIRSYYTVNRCHGSTVVFNNSPVRSANTASGRTSIAEKGPVFNIRANEDRYYYRTC